MGKQHPARCQLVEMWRPDTAASVGIERFNSQVIGEDQYDVGFVAWQKPGWSPAPFFLSDSSQSSCSALNFWKALYSSAEI